MKSILAALGNIPKAMIAAAPVRLWAMLLAGPPLTAYSIWVVIIVWKGPWSPAMEHDRLQILGLALMCLYALLAIIVVSLAAIRVKATGPGGLAFEADGDTDANTPEKETS
jgi:hypothetical protein